MNLENLEVVTDPDTITKCFMKMLGALPISLITKLQYQENFEFLTEEEKAKVVRAVSCYCNADDES